MKLSRVTITGADDSVEPPDLISLSKDFPFVEWAILFSPKKAGVPRYPSAGWRDALTAACEDTPVHLAAHVCGDWARQFLVGVNNLPDLSTFQRVQINFRASETPCDVAAFSHALRGLAGKQVIFQLDVEGRNEVFEKMARLDYGSVVEFALLFDGSGGTGVLPAQWRAPSYYRMDGSLRDHGYAGGLGPYNLAVELPRIAAAVGEAHVWIDMESRVRTDDDRVFDLERVRQVLELAAPFVVGEEL
jgi:hypothetical protein